MVATDSIRKALDDLKQERASTAHVLAQLDEAIAALEPLSASNGNLIKQPTEKPVPQKRTSVMPTLKVVLREHGGKRHTNQWTALVGKRISLNADNPQNSIATALLRLGRQGFVRAHGHNVFEYPGEAESPSGEQERSDGAS